MKKPFSLGLAMMTVGCATQQPRSIRYLALGDSYTIGESVEPGRTWPVQLRDRLQDRGVTVAEVVIIAQTGWTTDELSAGIDAAAPVGPFDLVSLLIGVNNQYRGRDAEEFRGEFTGLLERAIGFAGGDASRVLVVSIPDWGATPFGARDARGPETIGAQIDEFNAVKREEAERAGVRFVDITPISRRAPDEASLVAADGLHPSAEMYAEWVRLALPVVSRALDTPRE